MSNGFIETLSRVYRLGKLMHPGLGLSGAKHRVLLLARAIVFFPTIRDWYAIRDNPFLTRALQRFPLMHGAMYWPYINHTWPMRRRLATIEQHYRMLVGPAAIIADATFEEVEVTRLGAEYAGLRVVLDKAIWFLREGEVVLNLFVNDQRMYSVAFTLARNEAGLPIVLVGALQGSNSDAARGVYRDITHALHGMRPRDLLMVALKLLCRELGIDTIWAVSSDKHQHNSAYFGNSHQTSSLVAYNEVWRQHGGTERGNGFFEMPTVVKHRDMSEIPSRKRAAYRRRYKMLDKLERDTRNSCERHARQASGNGG